MINCSLWLVGMEEMSVSNGIIRSIKEWSRKLWTLNSVCSLWHYLSRQSWWWRDNSSIIQWISHAIISKVMMNVNLIKIIIEVLKVRTWGHGWWLGSSYQGQSGEGCHREAYLLAVEHLAKECGIVLMVETFYMDIVFEIITTIGYRCMGSVCCFSRTPWESFSRTGCAPCLKHFCRINQSCKI